MGSNPTQARGIAVFLISFVLIAAGLAGSKVFVPFGLVLLGISVALFLRCKPWEQEE
jgi:hypothetical protein